MLNCCKRVLREGGEGDVIKASETMCWENGVFVTREGDDIGCHKASKQPKLELQVLCTIGGANGRP